MGSDEESHSVDFMLVSTYVPAVILFVRAVWLVTMLEILVHFVNEMHVLLLVCIWIVYFDGFYFRHDKCNQLCGFLVPCALLYCINKMIQYETVQCEPTNSHYVVIYVCGVLWASISMFTMMYLFLDIVRNHLELHAVAAFTSGLGIAMLVFHCHTMEVWEIILRVLVYYVCTVLFYFFQSKARQIDRKVYNFIVKNIMLHVLFVDVLIACGSIGMCILFFIFVLRRDEPNAAHCQLNHSKEEKNTEHKSVTAATSKYAHQMQEISLEFGTEHVIAPNSTTREDDDHAVMAAFMAAKQAYSLP